MLLRKTVLYSFLLTSFGFGVGCGSNSSGNSSQPPVSAPSIVAQPQDLSVPMGIAATYKVLANGTNLDYQWFKNGVAISGATASTYTTPATAFSDSGSLFTVRVSDSAGTVASTAASLSVTARAPKAGDLRFQQVDADTTRNGYQASGDLDVPQSCLIGLQGSTIQYDLAGTGTSYFLGNDPCIMKYATFALPGSLTGIEAIYASLPISNYPANLMNTALWGQAPTPSDSGSVIQSLRLTSNTVGLSFTHSDTSLGFSGTSATTPETSLQATATQEGQHGRVITAVSSDGNLVTYFSYGWSGESSTLYETKVVFSTLSTAVTDVTNLAKEGYILTAAGGTQASDGGGVILVGTRVQGDNMPRPVSVGVHTTTSDTTSALASQGYAIVAVVQQYDVSGSITSYQFVGER